MQPHRDHGTEVFVRVERFVERAGRIHSFLLRDLRKASTVVGLGIPRMERMVEKNGLEAVGADDFENLADAVEFALEIPFAYRYADDLFGNFGIRHTYRRNEERRIGNDLRRDSDGFEQFRAFRVADRDRRAFRSEKRSDFRYVFRREIDAYPPKQYPFTEKLRDADARFPLEALFEKGLSFVVVKNSTAPHDDQIGDENFPKRTEKISDVRPKPGAYPVGKIRRVPNLPLLRNEGGLRIVRKNGDSTFRIPFAEVGDFGKHDGLVPEIVGSGGGEENDSANGHGRWLSELPTSRAP